MTFRTPRTAPTSPRRPVAPIHRGPQAVSQQQVGIPIHHAPNAALLIDFDNVTMGIRSDLGKELRSLLSSEIIRGKVAVQIVHDPGIPPGKLHYLPTPDILDICCSEEPKVVSA